MGHSHLLTPPSKWLEEYFVERGIPESKVMACPSGGDTNLFSVQDGMNICKKYQLSDSEIIIYVGTLGIQRHIMVLVKAFATMKEERVNVKLLIVGKGSDEENLRRLATELGVKDDVIIMNAHTLIEKEYAYQVAVERYRNMLTSLRPN